MENNCFQCFYKKTLICSLENKWFLMCIYSYRMLLPWEYIAVHVCLWTHFPHGCYARASSWGNENHWEQHENIRNAQWMSQMWQNMCFVCAFMENLYLFAAKPKIFHVRFFMFCCSHLKLLQWETLLFIRYPVWHSRYHVSSIRYQVSGIRHQNSTFRSLAVVLQRNV